MVIPVTYLGMLTWELRNLREQGTVWTMGRQHGQVTDDDVTSELHKSIAQMNRTNELHKTR